jgi:hypothetical protein
MTSGAQLSPEAERLVITANVIPKTTNSNSLLPNTASNDIQQHVNSANSGDTQFDCHSDAESCAPEVMVPDARVFSSMKEFELVVFGMTFAVITRRSASGHGVSVLSV